MVGLPGVPTATTVLMGGVGGADEENVFSWKAVGDCGGVRLPVMTPELKAGEPGLDPGAEDMDEA